MAVRVVMDVAVVFVNDAADDDEGAYAAVTKVNRRKEKAVWTVKEEERNHQLHIHKDHLIMHGYIQTLLVPSMNVTSSDALLGVSKINDKIQKAVSQRELMAFRSHFLKQRHLHGAIAAGKIKSTGLQYGYVKTGKVIDKIRLVVQQWPWICMH